MGPGGPAGRGDARGIGGGRSWHPSETLGGAEEILDPGAERLGNLGPPQTIQGRPDGIHHANPLRALGPGRCRCR